MWEKIEKINKILRDQGKAVIQEKKMQKDGKIIGKIQYGYIPQAVFDAVNAVLGPENWTYEVHSNEIIDGQAIACVEVFINTVNGWLSKGRQWGQSNVVKGNIGDALKGAVTDGIQKCFSLWSIGSDAYAGKLEQVWKNGKKGNAQDSMGPGSANSSNPKSDDSSLPQLDGVKYEKKEGKIVAIGKTYGKNNALKAAGFKWDPKAQYWYKQAA